MYGDPTAKTIPYMALVRDFEDLRKALLVLLKLRMQTRRGGRLLS